MAEDPVSQDQHRADMAELQLELAHTLALLDKRTELIAQDLVAFHLDFPISTYDLDRIAPGKNIHNIHLWRQ